jgi:hypothetical protein
VLPQRLERDLHKHDYVNFYHPHVNHAIAKSNVQIEQPRANLIDGGVEVLEAPCEDGIWHIE